MKTVWRVLTNNLGWKLLSVLLAVLLWIAVEGEPELVTVQSVPVFYRNVEPSLALVSNPPATVRVELRGPSDVLGPDNLSNVALVLDLAGETEPGEKVFPISGANVSLPAGVNFVRSDPPRVMLHLDRAPQAIEPGTERESRTETMRQLFGTDGIRGTAGEYPLDRPTTFAVGVALAQWIGTNHLNPEVVIGMDTRESGPWIAEHVAGRIGPGRRARAQRRADQHARPGVHR